MVGWSQPWLAPDVATLDTNSGSRLNTAIATPNVMISVMMIGPLPSSTSSSSAWTLALRTSQLGADHERLVEDHEPTHERPLGGARCADAAVERLRGGDDPAVRVAQGDGDRVAPAHEDALHQGLASVGERGSAARSAGGGRRRCGIR